MGIFAYSNLDPFIKVWTAIRKHIPLCVFLAGKAVKEETSASEDPKGSAHHGGPPGDQSQRSFPTVPQQCR